LDSKEATAQGGSINGHFLWSFFLSFLGKSYREYRGILFNYGFSKKCLKLQISFRAKDYAYSFSLSVLMVSHTFIEMQVFNKTKKSRALVLVGKSNIQQTPRDFFQTNIGLRCGL